LDELDIKIFRALISESAVAPSNILVRSSLRKIARQLGADDMTVNNRYKKLQKSGSMSVWQLIVNPTFFGYSMLDIMVYVQPESAKADMIRKLKLVHEVIVVVNFYGKALKIIVLYYSDESRSRTVELISRITNAEKVISSRMDLPTSETKALTETDIAVIRALSKDARKSSALVARELGFSAKRVRSRVDKLRKEKTIFTLLNLSIAGITGLIPAYLSYSYSNKEGEGIGRSVDARSLRHELPLGRVL
jgi:DNA-binding Lrp family transcriptional regulator